MILAIILWIAAAFVPESAAAPNEDAHPRKYVRVTAMIFSGLFLLLFVLNSFVQVGTKDVGIVTTFGRTSGHLSNGLHLKFPWQNVTSMDAAIQTDSYTTKDCLDVRIANQQTACVDVSIRWRIEPGYADSLFQNYRTFDNVRDSLVTRELKVALNQQLATYNPLNAIPTSTVVNGTGNYPNATPTLNAVGAAVTKQMQHEISDQGIDVLNALVPLITFDKSTQGRLNQLQQQEAQTRVAQAQLATNTAQALANQAIAASVQQNPAVLTAKCLDIMSELVKNGDKPPVGMCALGNSPGVLVNGG